MGVRDRLRKALTGVGWMGGPVSDHPESGGITGDLDPDDWPDPAEDDEKPEDAEQTE